MTRPIKRDQPRQNRRRATLARFTIISAEQFADESRHDPDTNPNPRTGTYESYLERKNAERATLQSIIG